MDELIQIAKKNTDTDYGKEDCDGEIYQKYSLETEAGRAFYEAIGDEMLLQVLREKAEVLGHSPAQKEIFWVWRDYMKERFQKWPYALKAAGLGKSAGKGGKALSKVREEQEEYKILVEKVREKAKALCRIPHPKDLPTVSQKLAKYAKNWEQVLLDAEIDEDFFQNYAVYKIKDLEPEYQRDLEIVKEMAEELHRSPFMQELPLEFRKQLIERCGSYRNALYQIGLRPVKKRHPFHGVTLGKEEKEEGKPHQRDPRHCYYQVVNCDAQTKQDLAALYEILEETGKLPDRKKVEPKLRKRLQKSCGSWANALYQLQDNAGKDKKK